MDFRGYTPTPPPAFLFVLAVAVIAGGAWLGLGLWWLAHHVTIAWQ